MRKFVVFIFKILVLLLVLCATLDFLYTKAYELNGKRGKVDFVYNGKPQDYDVVFLGSSRANNHFVPEMFAQKGLKAFNFGMSGGGLYEASLMLKLMLERGYKIKAVVVDADLNLNSDEPADAISSRFLPYLRDSETIKQHFGSDPNFEFYYDVPFYRYIAYENRIGFREMLFSAIGKKTNHLRFQGFMPLREVGQNRVLDISAEKPLRNRSYEEIRDLCQKKGIRFLPVMTPVCSQTKGMGYFQKVQKLYPEIRNYEHVVTNDSLFSSCGHLNEKGARVLTGRILRDFFGR